MEPHRRANDHRQTSQRTLHLARARVRETLCSPSIAVMLRIYCLQQWYNLSDPGAEEALYDIQSMRAFCDLELGRDPIPDETTILNFRHLLEAHELTKTVFEAVAEHLEARGALLRGGTIVDATLIAASPSTKNEARCARWRSLGVLRAIPVVRNSWGADFGQRVTGRTLQRIGPGLIVSGHTDERGRHLVVGGYDG